MEQQSGPPARANTATSVAGVPLDSVHTQPERQPRGKTIAGRMAVVGHAALGFAILIGLWYVVVVAFGLSSLVLPLPTQVLTTIASLARTNGYWRDIVVSLEEFIVGFVSGSLLGIAAGLALGISRPARLVGQPIADMLRFVVPFSLIPLVVAWFGFSPIGKIFLVAWAVLFVMMVSTTRAVDQIDPLLLKAAHMLHLGHGLRTRRVVIPAALPKILVGLRVSIGIAWVSVIAAEYLGSTAGLGYMITNAQTSLETNVILAGMITIGVIGAALSAFAQLLITRVLRARGQY